MNGSGGGFSGGEAAPLVGFLNGEVQTLDQIPDLIAGALLSSNATNVSQTEGGGGQEVSIDINYMPSPRHSGAHPQALLIAGIWGISLFTLILATAALIRKPTSDLIFRRNKIVYYLVVAVIWALGLGGAATAYCLSRPGGGNWVSFGRRVLCASIFYMVAALGIYFVKLQTLNQIPDLIAGALSNATNVSQTQGGGGQVSIDMPSPKATAPAPLIAGIWGISLFTLILATAALIRKPASDLIFGGNKIVYYTVVAVIWALGLGGAATAYCLSRPGGGNWVSFGRRVLCASIFDMVAALAIYFVKV